MILERLIACVAPHDCLGCGREGRLLCEGCAAGLLRPAPRCFRCHSLSPGGRTCQPCRRSSKLYSVRVATVYEGAAKDLVWQLKFAGARAAADNMAEMMSEYAAHSPKTVFVHVPTAASRVRYRGYDQAQLLARALSRMTRIPYVPHLARLGRHQQVGASRRQRMSQLEGAFRVRHESLLKGKHVVLIDDVLTTGATVDSAAKALKAAGASRVSALVFAQA